MISWPADNLEEGLLESWRAYLKPVAFVQERSGVNVEGTIHIFDTRQELPDSPDLHVRELGASSGNARADALRSELDGRELLVLSVT